MTIASGLESVAWVLSAVIAGWLVLDVVRIARNHDEHLLINAAETIDGPAELRPQGTESEPG